MEPANRESRKSVLRQTPAVHTTRSGFSGGVVIKAQQHMKKDWVNILFLTLTPVIGIVGTAAYTYYAGFSLWMPLLTFGMYLAVGMSICADRKSTRLNSSHLVISYAVFCLKKKTH